jgi:hypothetical protein
MMLSSSAVDRVCGDRLETTAKLIAVRSGKRRQIHRCAEPFANARGGRIDFRSFGRRHWKPAQQRAGIEPLRGLYDLRHTYATFALRAGVPVFAVSRFMGSSIAMIDYHYGHLAHDSREHAVSLLDALAFERVVDAGWTPPGQLANSVPVRISGHPRRRSPRTVDARWTSRRQRVVSAANERS